MTDGFDGFDDALGVTVGGIDGENVGADFGHVYSTFEEIAGSPDCGAYAEAAVVVFGGTRIFEFFLNVFYGDETFEVEILIDDEKFFDAVLLKNFFGLFESGADGNGDQIVFGHDLADELAMIFFEAKIAIGEDAGETRAAGDGKAGDAVFGHDLESLANGDVWGDGDGVDDHAGFGTFDAIDFFGLAIERHVAMNDADAALARDADGETRFRDGVHGGGSERNVDGEFASEAGGGVDVGGKHGGAAGLEKDVVERKTFGDGTVNH